MKTSVSESLVPRYKVTPGENSARVWDLGAANNLPREPFIQEIEHLHDQLSPYQNQECSTYPKIHLGGHWSRIEALVFRDN